MQNWIQLGGVLLIVLVLMRLLSRGSGSGGSC